MHFVVAFVLGQKTATEVYSTWVLVLQVTVYIGLLEFGIQTAVARFVAHADELDDRFPPGGNAVSIH